MSTTSASRLARQAGLKYVCDSQPGIRRFRRGKAFAYRGASGSKVSLRRALQIKSLAIPPAWTNVWICHSPAGHVQATGRDARGRKQYRYHPRWREIQDERKYDRIVEFGKALPRLRARVRRDLARPGLPRFKVLATVVRLLESSFVRVGNDAYARHNHSHGLTTLRDQHVRLTGSAIRFSFRGKSGQRHIVAVDDPRLARIVRRCRDVPGQELFQWLDDKGRRHRVTSADVNDYLRAATHESFTAKDFRTWAGTVHALCALQQAGRHASKREAKRRVLEAVSKVAKMLGNTISVCRKAYVDPRVIDAYLAGRLLARLPRKMKRCAGLSAAEATALEFLQRRA